MSEWYWCLGVGIYHVSIAVAKGVGVMDLVWLGRARVIKILTVAVKVLRESVPTNLHSQLCMWSAVRLSTRLENTIGVYATSHATSPCATWREP